MRKCRAADRWLDLTKIGLAEKCAYVRNGYSRLQNTVPRDVAARRNELDPDWYEETREMGKRNECPGLG